MMQFYRKKGFTLLELMIVIIIIGILASLAIPRFIKAAKKARYASAQQMLSSIRGSVVRYYFEYSVWPTVVGNLDVQMTGGAGWTVDNPNPTTNYGSVTHDATNVTYTIAEDGAVSPAP